MTLLHFNGGNCLAQQLAGVLLAIVVKQRWAEKIAHPTNILHTVTTADS